jgi:hypothetical protein
MVAFKSVKWTEEQAEMYRQYQQAQSQASEKSKLDRQVKDLKSKLVAAFGDELFATLPDGTVLQRIQKEREVQPAPGRTDKWWDISKVQ